MADPQLSTELKKAREEITAIQYESETLTNKLNELTDEYRKNQEAEVRTFQDIVDTNRKLVEEGGISAQEANANIEAAHATHLNNLAVLDKDYSEKRELLEIDTANKIKTIEKETAVKTLNTWSDAIGGVGDIFNALAETEEENSRKSLQLQRAAVYMNMAAGLATGIANAAEAGWPAMLATIPSTVAMLVAEFAQVKKLKSQSGYATGGLVRGPGSGTSDSINTNVSNGESIINAKATSLYAPLLDAINRSTGGAAIQAATNQNTFVQMLSQALLAMPNPVVSVRSIDDARGVYNRITQLRSY